MTREHVSDAQPSPIDLGHFGPPRTGQAETGSENAVARDLQWQHKMVGMRLAVRARWAALAAIAVMLPFLNPEWEMAYYHGLIGIFAVLAWLQLKAARVGASYLELLLIMADLVLLTVTMLLPNPLDNEVVPPAMQYRVGGFLYFFVFLASSTLAYSWRTVRGIGSATCVLWLIALALMWVMSTEDPALTDATVAAFGADTMLTEFLNPNDLQITLRIQEIVIFLIVANTLSLTVRRYGRLLILHTVAERARTNLSRYFSPNVVEELARNDEPLKQIRTQDIAVLFVDIVGFTHFAAGRTPQEAIVTLRQFHQLMETEVFRHNGTLDKYLGDGLMATFGTPSIGDRDATNALACARAMSRAMVIWNEQRSAQGESPIRVGFGLHFGPAVLGDIGASRLEFAVIGNTVNVASRIEALTRALNVELAASDDLVRRVREESGNDPSLDGLERHDGQEIRGLDDRITLWGLASPTEAR